METTTACEHSLQKKILDSRQVGDCKLRRCLGCERRACTFSNSFYMRIQLTGSDEAGEDFLHTRASLPNCATLVKDGEE